MCVCVCVWSKNVSVRVSGDLCHRLDRLQAVAVALAQPRRGGGEADVHGQGGGVVARHRPPDDEVGRSCFPNTCWGERAGRACARG